ncbi:MAG: hypothetical protein JNM18_08610 [Planctomycetaceae bacterium]|nr:hypothetical protein [Planctomycetaceae bacterium]
MANPPSPSIEPIASCVEQGTLYALAIDVRRGIAYFGGSERSVRSWRLNDEPVRSELAWHGRGAYVSSLVLAHDEPHGPVVITGHYDGSLTWHEPATGRVLMSVESAHHGWVRDLALSGDGRRLVSVGNDMLVRCWDRATGTLQQTFAGHAAETPEGYVSTLYSVAISPDGRCAASADRAGEVRVWDLERGSLVAQWRSAEFYTFDPEKRDRSMGGIRRVRFSPDGSTLAVAGIGQITNVDGFVGPARVELWDWRAVKRRSLLGDSHNAVLNDVVFTANGQHVVAGGGGDSGGVLLSWQLGKEKPVQKVKLKGHIHRLAWATGDRLLTAGFEAVQLWSSAAVLATEESQA